GFYLVMFAYDYYKCSRLEYRGETSTFTVEVFYWVQHRYNK
ncbi:MAG: hypothetical protein ACI849_001134, partial [Patiriisocius sp.]